jgi:hypothetical protein
MTPTMHHQLETLEQLARAMTVELMDSGGTNPYATCNVIAEEAPDLYKLFGRDRILAWCDAIQRSDVPEESARLQKTFLSFNTTYFAGQLPQYEVRVVYDIDPWVGEVSRDPSAGYIDLDRRQIFIRFSSSRRLMIGMLVHEMAHAATNPSHDDEWVSEIKRLKRLGAPVVEWELD